MLTPFLLAAGLLHAPVAGKNTPDAVNLLRSSVARAADVNADGIPDFAVARRIPETMGPLSDAPFDRVWILSGRDGSLLRTYKAPGLDDRFGRVLRDVGDVNGDGQRDLAIAGRRRVWVFSGVDGQQLHRLSIGPSAPLNIAGGLDVDGDRVPDIAVYGVGDRRSVTLHSGATGNLLQVVHPRVPPQSGTSEPADVRLTGGVALVPDRTGDGLAEIALTYVEFADPGDDARAEVLAVHDLQGLDRLQRSVLPNEQTLNEAQAWELRALGDIDLDGVDELILTVEGCYALVYSGKTGIELRRHSWVGAYLNGEGTSLDVLDDHDGDGLPEYLLAANEDTFDCDPGFAVLRSGADGKSLGHLRFDYDDALGGCGAGVDATGIGDVDGDGLGEIAVHMPRLEEVRILSGADFSALVRAAVPAVVVPLEAR